LFEKWRVCIKIDIVMSVFSLFEHKPVRAFSLKVVKKCSRSVEKQFFNLGGEFE